MTAQHLVHGMGPALEPPAWPRITHAEAAAALARFPQAGRLRTLAWHSPRPFAAAALAETDQGRLFLKRHHSALRPPASLAPEHGFIAHLANAGLPVVRLLHSDEGGTILADGVWTWELHEAAPGLDLYRDRPSWTPFLTHPHAAAAGAALARLHIAAEGFDAPSRAAAPLVASQTILPSADPLAAADAYIAARPPLQHYLAGKNWRADLARIFTAHAADGLAPHLAAQPPLWTHNDWHPSNLLWAPEGEVAQILDFGLADRTCALHDLAIALERSVVRWLDLAPAGPPITDLAAARTLLAAYHAVRPLSAADRTLLARLLPLVHIEFALSEAAYFQGLLNRPRDADLAWHGYLIGHADWFSGDEGQALLAVIAEPPEQ